MTTSLPPPVAGMLVHDRFASVIGVSEADDAAPTAEEMAAVVAAIEHLWPKPVIALPGAERETPPWRFSGRWWSRPTVTRRDRPWVS